jgi:hypothetical protein
LLYERVKEVKNFQSVPFTLESAGQATVKQYVLSLASVAIYDEVRARE